MEPAGDEGEMLVLFDHAEEGAGDTDEGATHIEDIEIRAAVMYSSFGRGLFCASRVKSGQHLTWYDGERIARHEYCTLTEDTGLWHTLSAPGGLYVNGWSSSTGAQYANSGRKERPNNAKYKKETALLQASAGMPRCRVCARACRPLASAMISTPSSPMPI